MSNTENTTPPAGAAGGGSGDLGALSAGATRDHIAEEVFVGNWIHNRWGDPVEPNIEARVAWRSGLPKGAHKIAYAIADAILASAPTPDLGAQGEPGVIGREEPIEPEDLRRERREDRDEASSVEDEPTSWPEHMRGSALYPANRKRTAHIDRLIAEAPAASRTGSGVSVEEIEDALERGVCPGCNRDCIGSGGGTSPSDETCDAWRCNWQPPTREDQVRRILALFAQAPRDGGWQPIETAPKDGTWILGLQADSAKYGGKPANVVRWVDRIGWTLWDYEGPKDPTHWRPLPTPPSGVETIRQDNTSGGKADAP